MNIQLNKFDNYKFRASSLPDLMTNSRSKSEPLSETAKELIRRCWIREVFNREEVVYTPAMVKGTICEKDSIGLLQIKTGEIYYKNDIKYENEFITGTPDIVNGTSVYDIKTPFTIFTYAKVDAKQAEKDYYWQLAGYAWLTGKSKASLVYCLVNTPEKMLEKEIYKAGAETEEEVNRIIQLHNFDDIDLNLRIKKYDFEFTPEVYKQIEERVILAREYMNSLSLSD